MKFPTLIILAVIILVACNKSSKQSIASDKSSFANNRSYIIKHIKRLTSTGDSLSKVFNASDFNISLDTLKVDCMERPQQIALIQYHCASCYTVSLTNILILQHHNDGEVYLFKYNKALGVWKQARHIMISENNVKSFTKKISASHDWIDKKVYNPMNTNGDIVRYNYYSSATDSATFKTAFNPSSQITNLFGDLFKVQSVN